MDIGQLKALILKKPIMAYAAAVFVLVLWGVSFINHHDQKFQAKEGGFQKNNIGLSVGGVDEKVYIARLEKNYYEFEDRVKSIEDKVNKFYHDLSDIKKSNRELNKGLKDIDKHFSDLVNERLGARTDMQANAGQNMELAIAHVRDIDANEQDVYLPMGSFCKGTLLTGVFAAADINNPLPVLIALDEAFYGPNNTRVPLKGAFVIGKAVGDLVSERALIQIVGISMVLPDAQAFEHNDNLGYVTDEYGELGLHGEIIRNTGKALALSFMGGFLSGGSQAIADQEVTRTETAYGGLRQDVTGSASKQAIFSGLAKTAGRMSDYYEKQAEQLVPAVHIRSGSLVYFIVQKGMRINGLLRSDHVPVMSLN